MNIGYVRVSSEGQNTARQEVLMRELGVERLDGQADHRNASHGTAGDEAQHVLSAGAGVSGGVTNIINHGERRGSASLFCFDVKRLIYIFEVSLSLP